MRLRKLKLKDAPYMLEWMHDESVVRNMETDFSRKTIDDCIKFIVASNRTVENVHMGIVDSNDIYMGTVSLKNVDNITKSAEFAITLRKSAMGKGYALFGIQAIIQIGFKKINLNNIYWYVAKENIRALRFYDKNNYKRFQKSLEALNCVVYNAKKDYVWYLVKNIDEALQ